MFYTRDEIRVALYQLIDCGCGLAEAGIKATAWSDPPETIPEAIEIGKYSPRDDSPEILSQNECCLSGHSKSSGFDSHRK